MGLTWICVGVALYQGYKEITLDRRAPIVSFSAGENLTGEITPGKVFVCAGGVRRCGMTAR